MADITLSKAVRSNLLNLQSTATQLGKTQQRLATGLKVNSALDNPTNFFTASSLNSRAGDLGRLLDAVGNATQTIEAANNGLSAITKLVESAQATARQALQTTGAVTANKITGSTTATYNPQALTTVVGDNSVATGTGGGPLTADAVATLSTGDVGADAANSTATGSALIATLTSGAIAADTTIGAIAGSTVSDGTLLSAAGAGSLANSDSLTFKVNGVSKTVNFVNTGTVDLATTDVLNININQTIDTLATSLNTLFTTGSATGVTVTRATGAEITFTSDSTVQTLSVADGQNGATLTKLGIAQGDVTGEADNTASGATGDYILTKNSTLQALAAANDTLTVTTTTGGTETITFGADANQIGSLSQLVSTLNGFTGVNATANGTTKFDVAGVTAGETITFGGNNTNATTALGLNTTAYNSSTDLLSSLGVSNGDSLVVSLDGTDYTVNFTTSSAAIQDVPNKTLTIGIDQSLSTFGTALATATGATVNVANSGAVTFTSSADNVRIHDGANGTVTSELGFGAVGDAYTAGGAAGGTTDRLFAKNSTIQTLAARGATLATSVGGVTQTALTFGVGSNVSTRADLLTALNGLANLNAVAGTGNAIDITNSTATDYDGNIVFTADSSATASALGLTLDSGSTTVSTTKPQNILNRGYVNQGETLDIKVGNSATLTVTFGNGTGEVSTFGELNAKLENLAAGAASVNTANGNISITSDKGGDNITVGGTASVLTNFGLTKGEFGNLVDSGIGIADGDKLNIQIGTNSLKTITFGTATGQVNTLSELESALGSVAGGSVSIDTKTGAISISATNGSDSITVTSTTSADVSKDSVASAFGLSNSTTAVTSKTTDSAQRSTLETQFNDLLTQINQLSADASFNGVNLLGGNDLNVIFNEDSSSKLDIRGVTFNASGLGLSRAASGAFQTDANINDTLTSLDSAISSLRSQATTFGSNLSVVETRQNFTKEMINTLETGASNLTLADTNEEAANLLALQTRQQLSSTALSLASQSDQNVLRLF